MSTRGPTNNQEPVSLRQEPLARLLRDAAIVVLVSTGVGLSVNALRPSGSIPLIGSKPYDIVVPCPEPIGDVSGIAPTDARLLEPTSLVIDARSVSEFEAFHLPRAISIPFDWLGPPVATEVANTAKRIARSNAQRVMVYGDGDDPDSGREWARLLAGGGIKNVFYVMGGAPALTAHVPPAQGGHP